MFTKLTDVSFQNPHFLYFIGHMPLFCLVLPHMFHFQSLTDNYAQWLLPPRGGQASWIDDLTNKLDWLDLIATWLDQNFASATWLDQIFDPATWLHIFLTLQLDWRLDLTNSFTLRLDAWLVQKCYHVTWLETWLDQHSDSDSIRDLIWPTFWNLDFIWPFIHPCRVLTEDLRQFLSQCNASLF